jgi:simple sugar transport system permease protein
MNPEVPDMSDISAAAAPLHETRRVLTTRLRRLLRRPEAGALFAAIVVYLFFAFATRETNFVSLNGTAAWLNSAAELGIIAVSVGLLLIAGEFDLSIGAVVGASSIALAIGTKFYQIDIWIMIAFVLAGSSLIGFINGLMVERTGLPSFIVTLATLLGVSGASLGLSRLLTNTTTVSLTTPPLAHAVFAGRFGQANIAIIWWIAITAVAAWVLSKTAFGNWIYATGGNLAAARSSGVPTSRVKITLFVTTALAASLVGVIQALEFHSGNAANGQGYVFQAPIVAVIGGILLSGGYGSAMGIFLGSVIYGVISIGIFYTGWNTDWIQLFLGGLLLAAVMANSYFRQLALSAR